MKTFVILSTLVAYTLAAPHNEPWAHASAQPSWSLRSSDPDFFGPPRSNLEVNGGRTTLNQPINAPLALRHNAVELSGLHDGIQVNLPGAHSNQNLQRTAPLSLPESHKNFQKSINIASDAMDNIESGLGANSDSNLHHSIKTAKEALRFVQQGFTNNGDLEPSATSVNSIQSLKSVDEHNKRMKQWKQSMENIQNRNGKSDDAIDVKKDDNVSNTLEQKEEKVKIDENKKDQTNVAEDQKKIEEIEDVDKIKKVDTVKQELQVSSDKLELKTEMKPIEKPAVDIKPNDSQISSVAVDQINEPSKIIENVSEKKSEHIKSSEIQSKNNIPMDKLSQKSVRVEDLSEENLKLNATKTDNKVPKMSTGDQSSKASNTMESWAHHAHPMARAMVPHDMRMHNLARSAYGGDSGLPQLGGLSPGAGAGSAIGIFPKGQHSNCAIPILLSCSPSVVSGSLSKYHNAGYGAPSYRSQDLNMRQAIMS